MSCSTPFGQCLHAPHKGLDRLSRHEAAVARFVPATSRKSICRKHLAWAKRHWTNCRAFRSNHHLGTHWIAFPNSLTRQNQATSHGLRRSCKRRAVNATVQTQLDVDQFVKHSQGTRNHLLAEQAQETLDKAVETSEHPVFPCALIAGDVVILDLLSKRGYLKSGRVTVVFIDTFHLFPETHAFLHRLEDKYGFKATVFHAADCKDKKEFRAKHGPDLFMTDIDEYDRICKVEPFNRSLKETSCDMMINGRRRDHGFERAHLELFEHGKPVKCNPLAWWEFKDCFNYIEEQGLEAHPLHKEGFPSIGDEQSTVPVPKEKWFEYAGERSGRFQGYSNKDGTAKTECGIHVAGDDEESGMSNIRK